MFLTILLLPLGTKSQNFDTLGEQIIFYPSSLMLSYHSRPLIFFNDTKLLNIAVKLSAVKDSKKSFLSISQNCSPAQAQFLMAILGTVETLQKVII